MLGSGTFAELGKPLETCHDSAIVPELTKHESIKAQSSFPPLPRYTSKKQVLKRNRRAERSHTQHILQKHQTAYCLCRILQRYQSRSIVPKLFRSERLFRNNCSERNKNSCSEHRKSFRRNNCSELSCTFFCFAKTKTKLKTPKQNVFFVLGYLFQIIATNSNLGHKGAIHRWKSIKAVESQIGTDAVCELGLVSLMQHAIWSGNCTVDC